MKGSNQQEIPTNIVEINREMMKNEIKEESFDHENNAAYLDRFPSNKPIEPFFDPSEISSTASSGYSNRRRLRNARRVMGKGDQLFIFSLIQKHGSENTKVSSLNCMVVLIG